MADEFAAANVNRTYTLATTSIAIFTFTLIFLYPRFMGGEANALLFQTTLADMGVATFSFVFSSLCYYRSSLGDSIDQSERVLYSRCGDRFWLLGSTLMFLAPSLILFSINLLVVACVWFTLWLVYLLFATRMFPGVQTPRADSRGES